MDLDLRRKKLLFRAHHRGFREADLMIGGFADAHLGALDEQGLDAFEEILGVPDQDLYAWVVGNELPPADFDNPLLDRLRQFSYADRPVQK